MLEARDNGFDEIIIGAKGGTPKAYKPKEDPNDLQANTYVKIIDLLCEGQIVGPANDNNWEKSTYLDETPIKSSGDNYNFQGITLDYRLGTEDQTVMEGFDGIETAVDVGTEITYSTFVTRTINDTDVDHVKVAITVPQLVYTTDKGDRLKTTVKIKIEVIPEDGAGIPVVVITGSGDKGEITGKCIAPYVRQFKIENLSEHGDGPWEIKVTRLTEDATTDRLQNTTYFSSYITVIDDKINYSDSAIVGIKINAEDFGNQVPSRAYKLNGRIIEYPSNYNLTERTYDGVWDGNYTTSSTIAVNNPAWIVRDIIVNDRFGVKRYFPEIEDYLDKWTLYELAQYCDETVVAVERIRQNDGSYTTVTGSEPRFTFNAEIKNAESAITAINTFAAVCRAVPVWDGEYLTFIQDKEADEYEWVATNANVVDGLFQYEYTPRESRHTAIRVTYNNPDRFGKQEIVTYEDDESISDYGYNPLEFAAFGCTSRTEALRRGRYALAVDTTCLETVQFSGGFEWALKTGVRVGQVGLVQDNHRSNENFGGRVASATTTSITLDREVTLETDVTYTIYVKAPDGTVYERTITNSPGDHTTVNVSEAMSPAPPKEAVWVMGPYVQPYRIVSMKYNTENGSFDIIATQYVNIYTEVESGLTYNRPPTTSLNEGALEPPTNLVVEGFTYAEGDLDNRKYGIDIGWTHADDVRRQYYEVQAKGTSEGYHNIGNTSTNGFEWKNVTPDEYDIRVRTVGAGLVSEWTIYADFNLNATVSGILPPTGLQIAGVGGTEFSGRDCHIVWTLTSGHYYNGEVIGDSNVKGYIVKVYDGPGGTLLRTHQTPSKTTNEYIYTYAMNLDDGGPDRSLYFEVYSLGIYDDLSTPATLAASNPAPDMSSSLPVLTPKYNYIKVEWPSVSDNDMEKYVIYADVVSPPISGAGTVSKDVLSFEVFGFDYGDDIYVQIEPYDLFGSGVKSQIPGAVQILKVPGINVDVELQQSTTITVVSGLTYSGTLSTLYDDVRDSGGITFTPSAGQYIQYNYGIPDYINRLSIWSANANPQVYLAVSEDGSSWSWIKAEADHTTDDDGYLFEATDESDAATNYWQLAAGFNVGLFPFRSVAKYVRTYFVNTNSTQIYELVPARITISELAAIGSLSAISANVGVITAGSLQSDDYSPTEGILIDLDEKDIKIKKSGSTIFDYDGDTGNLTISGTVTFKSGTTGYTNITDKPTLGTLAGLSSVGASDCDTTIIDGGKVITGLLTASNVQTGTLSTENVTISSTDGKTYFSGNTMYVKDASSVTRVKIGKLS